MPLCIDQIIYRDDSLVVLDKPAGMPTHPGRGCREVESLLTAARSYLGCWVYPVHRLDRATSGVVVFALSPEKAAELGAHFSARRVAKTYHALVRGWLTGSGTIDRTLARLDRGGEQDATTHYRCLATWEQPWSVRPYASSRYSLLELKPETGRTHQLRRHLAGAAHPIVGDTRYGDGAHNAAVRSQLSCHRLLLHAQELKLPEFPAPFVSQAAGLASWMECSSRNLINTVVLEGRLVSSEA